MEIIEFCLEHLDLFQWNTRDLENYGTPERFYILFKKAQIEGMAYTGIYDGRIMGIAGLIPYGEKVAYGFAGFSKYAKSMPVSCIKIIKHRFINVAKDMGLHRIVTYNIINSERNNRFCEWLGFEKEALVRKFDDEGKDYIQYGYVL